MDMKVENSHTKKSNLHDYKHDDKEKYIRSYTRNRNNHRRYYNNTDYRRYDKGEDSYDEQTQVSSSVSNQPIIKEKDLISYSSDGCTDKLPQNNINNSSKRKERERDRDRREHSRKNAKKQSKQY